MITEMKTETQDERWQAVTRHERAADGRFVYAVRTTGVYCRPSCPSRRPLRSNVDFFADPAAAERAGFRACLRCRPKDEHGDAGAEKVDRACRLIEQAIENGDHVPSLAELGTAVGSSPYHLQRLFTKRLGISPRDYAAAQRLARVKTNLKQGKDVTGALYDAGYGSSSRLYEAADAQLGMTPATYRRHGEGAEIGFTIAASPLGSLLVAATAKGLCAVMLGDDEATLRAELHRDFSAATIRRDDERLGRWVDDILGHLDGRLPALDLPLDLRASAFQWQVWRELRRIPYGTTQSYQDIAARIGKPKAARAVGHACATNPVSLVIPCHRVLRGDGSLGGYRWGTERKTRLLDREKSRG